LDRKRREERERDLEREQQRIQEQQERLQQEKARQLEIQKEREKDREKHREKQRETDKEMRKQQHDRWDKDRRSFEKRPAVSVNDKYAQRDAVNVPAKLHASVSSAGSGANNNHVARTNIIERQWVQVDPDATATAPPAERAPVISQESRLDAIVSRAVSGRKEHEPTSRSESNSQKHVHGTSEKNYVRRDSTNYTTSQAGGGKQYPEKTYKNENGGSSSNSRYQSRKSSPSEDKSYRHDEKYTTERNSDRSRSSKDDYAGDRHRASNRDCGDRSHKDNRASDFSDYDKYSKYTQNFSSNDSFDRDHDTRQQWSDRRQTDRTHDGSNGSRGDRRPDSRGSRSKYGRDGEDSRWQLHRK
jgi:hypothetical protein